MLIGILSVRNQRYHPNRRLIEAGTELGHKVSLIHPRHCFSRIGAGKAVLKMPSINERPDVLLPRIGATINDYALSLVRHFELSGFRVVNGFQSILLARNKFLCLQALGSKGISIPHSHLVGNLEQFENAIKRLGGYPVVVKALSARQGTGVVLVDSPVTGEFIIHNLQDRSQGLLVQEYMASDGRRDIRAFVLGNRVAGAMELRPRSRDFRSNIHLTGSGRPVELRPALARLAIRSTRTLGLEISGTDIIIDANGIAKVVEVNYSPGFRGLEASTGLDIASEIIRYATERYGGAS